MRIRCGGEADWVGNAHVLYRGCNVNESVMKEQQGMMCRKHCRQDMNKVRIVVPFCGVVQTNFPEKLPENLYTSP